MAAELELSKLIDSMSPTLMPEVYVFATVDINHDCNGIRFRMQFFEEEGITFILKRQEAETAGLAYEFPCRMITLNIHSALDAVGFIAKIATKLAGLGMGVNPVAGFYHDHLFVPEDRAEDAMKALHAMTKN